MITKDDFRQGLISDTYILCREAVCSIAWENSARNLVTMCRQTSVFCINAHFDYKAPLNLSKQIDLQRCQSVAAKFEDPETTKMQKRVYTFSIIHCYSDY